jgi:hypothetical protein
MKKCLGWRTGWIGLATGFILAITACSAQLRSSRTTIPAAKPAAPVSRMTTHPVPHSVPKPPSTISVAGTPPLVLPANGLTTPNPAANGLTMPGVGDRPDPFSNLPLGTMVVVKQNRPPSVAVAPTILPPTVSSAFGPDVAVPPAPTVVTLAPTAPLASTAPLAPTAPAPAIPAPMPQAPAQIPAPASVPPVAAAAPALPPAPVVQPLSAARAIAISGIVQAGNRTSIIVQVPNESSTRYVAVGDYLANGQVLVKRIDTSGGEPVVVLEQDGTEVVKSVGSGSLGSL